MREFFLIFNSRLRITINSLAQASPIKIVSFLFVITCFLVGTYYLLYRIFNFLSTVEIIGFAIIDRTVEMGFFVFFIMLLFSNIITSFSTFYNNRELNFLFSLPIKPTSIYLVKLFENSIYASWATMVVALPLVIAYGVCTKAFFLFYPFSIMSVFIYIIIPGAIASILIFIILSLFPQLKSRDVIILCIIFIIGLTFLYIKINNPSLLKIFETENELELLQFATNLTTVGGKFVPSTWLSNILKGLKIPNRDGMFYFLLLFFVSLSSVIIAFFMAKVLYHQSWLRVGEHQTKKNRMKSLLSLYQRNGTRAFFLKDILIFIREPTQWVQLSIFIILLIIYVFSLTKTPLYFAFPVWRTIVSFANFAYVSFVLATLGVRFIFPSVSLEHDGLWLIASSPLSFKRIIKIKYFLNLLIAAVIIEALLIFANIFIKTDQRMNLIMPIIGLFVAASLVSINLGLGSRFPQFNEDNPSKIAAGTGGIITALVSITYVGVSIVILAMPAYNFLTSQYFNRPSNYLLISLSFMTFILFNILTISLPLYLGIRALGKRDF